MDERSELHVVSPRPERLERLAAALPAPPPATHASLGEFEERVGGGPGVVVVDQPGGVPPGDLLSLLRDIADRGRDVTVLIPEDDGGAFRFRPLSMGFPVEGDRARKRVRDEDDGRAPLDLHEMLRFVSRVRHDINNPLTAGMAETQLLLMDLGEEGEVGESLRTIQRQLQRIQGHVLALGRLGRPRPES